MNLDQLINRGARAIEIVGARRVLPVRIQRQRTKGWRVPAGAVYVGRPSQWGNPFRIGGWFRFVTSCEGVRIEFSRTQRDDLFARIPNAGIACQLYKHWLTPEQIARAKKELGGHDLMCWCALHEPCHADVLLELANL
jgi:Domain of unknown function (DUF4326)